MPLRRLAVWVLPGLLRSYAVPPGSLTTLSVAL